jgi:hypothetical protein
MKNEVNVNQRRLILEQVLKMSLRCSDSLLKAVISLSRAAYLSDFKTFTQGVERLLAICDFVEEKTGGLDD